MAAGDTPRHPAGQPGRKIAGRGGRGYGQPMRATLLTTACLASALVGCPSAPVTPADTLDAYLRVLEADDANAAYALMGAEYRSRIDEGTFTARFEAARARGLERLRGAQAAGWPELERTASLDHGGDRPVSLALVDGRWVLVGGVLEFYPRGTPRETLRSFVRALEGRRYDVLVRFAPSGLQADLDAARLKAHVEAEWADVAALLERLAPHLEDPISVSGDRAVLRYDGLEFEMVHEADGWRVEDPD